MNKQLTPFEQAALNRQKGVYRLTGILVATALVQRIKLMQASKTQLSKEERAEWNAMLVQVIQHQIQHFGYDA